MEPLTVVMNFVVPEDEPGAEEYGFAKRLSTGRSLTIKPSSVAVANLRGRNDAPVLDTDGFAVHKMSWEGLDGEAGWEDRYTEAMGKWLQGYLGAKRVVTYNYHVRRRIAEDDPERPQEFDPTKLQPAMVAHVDNSQIGAFKRCMSSLGINEEEARASRLAVINLWRPIGHPAMDSPLALCDARTVRDEDLEITTDVYGEGSFLKKSDRHRWYYLRDCAPDEMLLLRCYDSIKGPSEGGVTPHSAFLDKDRVKEGVPLRQSIEVRCVVQY